MMRDLMGVLRAAHIDHIYGVADEALRPIADAARDASGIGWLELRNDEAAACAAADYAEHTGHLAVCAGSCGVGRVDLIRGLRDAHESGAPVLALALHISLEWEPAGVVREIHPARAFAGCSSYCGVVDDPSQISRLARTAMQHALVRGGVAALLLDPSAVAGSRASPGSGALWRAGGAEIPRRRASVGAEHLGRSWGRI